MAELTATEQTRIRRKLGIADGAQVPFTDDVFNDMYTEAAGDFNQAIVLALRDLLMDSAKLVSYKVGQTSEQLSDIYDRLEKQLVYYETIVVGGAAQVVVAGMRPVPYRHHERPYTDPAYTRSRYRRW